MPPKKDAKGGKGGAKAKPGKAAPIAAKSGGSGGKNKKKKWSKTKTKEKANNLVLFDKATYERLTNEVPSYRLITPSVLSERLRINGSLARRALKDLEHKNLIKPILKNAKLQIYTRASAGVAPVAAST
eukprot:TRINITY_DN9231_c0_g1_i1.p1 TRINITY_DN9231_c0_g1~~TRINITY_DN9231_c0_g1_i1.p1  ORF type:complete len:129 (-),score=37.86 TRINITY_DN9231_c0_g1_i1:50-436(-)